MYTMHKCSLGDDVDAGEKLDLMCCDRDLTEVPPPQEEPHQTQTDKDSTADWKQVTHHTSYIIS